MGRYSIAFYVGLVYVLSLFYSKAGLSISMILLIVLGLYKQRKSLSTVFIRYVKYPVSIGLSFVFFVFLFSYFNSENSHEWLHQLRIKLPFLLLPSAFFCIKHIAQKEHNYLHLFLAIVSVVSTIPVLSNFWKNKETMLSLISQGHYIPTPIDHIHYSIIIAYAACAGLLFIAQGTLSRFEKILFTCCSLWLIIALHILAVRTGLVILYVGCLFVLGKYILTKNNFRFGLIAGIIALMLPFLALKTMPSLKQKVDYMIYDLEQFQRGGGKDHSDSERLMSYAIAIDLIKERPLFGHGVGDLKKIMEVKHKEKYGKKQKYIYPHNQFLYVLSCVGCIGFFVFFIGLYSPLFYKPNAFLWLIFITMTLSFLVENTLQRAVSIAFFLLFIFWNSKSFNNQTS